MNVEKKSIRERELEAAKKSWYTGAKWDASRDITDIAKLVRKDIKKAVKAGFLPAAKYSVTSDRYSMGRSLSVVVRDVEYLTVNPKRIAWEMTGRHGDMPDDARTWKSVAAMETEKAIESIIKVYNFDKSITIEDYYHSGFAYDVKHCHTKEAVDRAAVRAELKEHPEFIEVLKKKVEV